MKQSDQPYFEIPRSLIHLFPQRPRRTLLRYDDYDIIIGNSARLEKLVILGRSAGETSLGRLHIRSRTSIE